MKHLLRLVAHHSTGLPLENVVSDKLLPRLKAFPYWFFTRPAYAVIFAGISFGTFIVVKDAPTLPENRFVLYFWAAVMAVLVIWAWVHMERVIRLFQKKLRTEHATWMLLDKQWLDSPRYLGSLHRALKYCRRYPWRRQYQQWKAIDAGNPERPGYESASHYGPVEWELLSGPHL